MQQQVQSSTVNTKRETSIKQGYINELNDAKTRTLINSSWIGCFLGVVNIVVHIIQGKGL